MTPEIDFSLRLRPTYSGNITPALSSLSPARAVLKIRSLNKNINSSALDSLSRSISLIPISFSSMQNNQAVISCDRLRWDTYLGVHWIPNFFHYLIVFLWSFELLPRAIQMEKHKIEDICHSDEVWRSILLKFGFIVVELTRTLLVKKS